MKYRNDLKYYSKDSQLIPISLFDERIFTLGESVYEVVRIHNAQALFLTDHLERLQQSIKIVYGDFQCSTATLTNDLNQIIRANHISEGNLKIELRKNTKGFSRILYFIPHRYPTKAQITQGIKMRFQFDERPNPKAKVSNWQVRGNANSIIDTHHIYETLLVNSDGYITEGSRSNIFFIKDEKLFSAPEEWILPGITRKKVLELCKSQNIEVQHRKIHHTELNLYDAAFITGTSPGVLQIQQIEDFSFKVNHPVYQNILKQYKAIANLD